VSCDHVLPSYGINPKFFQLALVYDWTDPSDIIQHEAALNPYSPGTLRRHLAPLPYR